jgi:hypothetical protein
MTNGEIDLNTDLKIAKRIHIISNLEQIIKESIYYRTHAEDFNLSSKISICSLEDKDTKKKIL